MALTPPQPPIPQSSLPHFVEQYKAYLKDLGNIGSRQAQTTTWYVSILSALMVFIAYIAQSERLHLFAYASIAPSAVVGILLCVLWHFHARSYQYLYNAKFAVLREMERVELHEHQQTALPFACYTLENELLDPKRIRFTNVERRLSLALMFPFIVIFVLALVKCFGARELW